jgi:hypothetical protein
VAGNRAAVAFADGSIDVIFEYCKGIPRLTNILCDFLLLTAFNEDTRAVDPAMVHDIAKDLEFESLYWGKNDCPPKQTTNYSALLDALRIGDMKEQ